MAITLRELAFLALLPVLVHLFFMGLDHRGTQQLMVSAPMSALLVTIAVGPAYGAFYFFAAAVPTTIVCWFYHQSKTLKGKKYWYPLPRLFGVLVALSVAHTLVYLALLWQLDLFHVERAVQGAMRHVQRPDLIGHPQKIEQMLVFLKRVIPYVPGLLGTIQLYIVLGAGALAQMLLQKLKKLKRPVLLLKDLYLPWGFWYGLAICGALAIVLSSGIVQLIAKNAVVVLLGTFFLQGLAVLHFVLSGQKNSFLFLVISYGIMILFPWLFIMMILVGLFEPWVRIRERFQSRKE